jgi:membrane associated rhomboid family serine protease
MAWQDRPYYRDEGSHGLRLGFTPPSPMALMVMAACFGVFVLESVSGGEIIYWGELTFRNHLAWTQPWRWITYQYIHGGSMHIFWNILAIYFFLPPLERLWGWKRAFAFYTAGGVVGGACFGIVQALVPQAAYLIGASGSILAALGACALLFPEKQVLLLIFPVPIRLLALLLGLLFTLTVIGERNLSNAAHLGGLVFGFVAPYYGGPAWHRLQRRMHLAKARAAIEQERADDELVDRILQKVHDTGMQSLTRWERKALKRATERQRVAEIARGRRGM